jgi:UDP-glucose 4-epimerase
MNVCTGEATSTKQLISHLQKELGSGSEILYADRRAGDLMRSLLDPTRCLATIGPATSLADGLSETARWFKARA